MNQFTTNSSFQGSYLPLFLIEGQPFFICQLFQRQPFQRQLFQRQLFQRVAVLKGSCFKGQLFQRQPFQRVAVLELADLELAVLELASLKHRLLLLGSLNILVIQSWGQSYQRQLIPLLTFKKFVYRILKRDQARCHYSRIHDLDFFSLLFH